VYLHWIGTLSAGAHTLLVKCAHSGTVINPYVIGGGKTSLQYEIYV
jgi:hypothetical protein